MMTVRAKKRFFFQDNMYNQGDVFHTTPSFYRELSSKDLVEEYSEKNLTPDYQDKSLNPRRKKKITGPEKKKVRHKVKPNNREPLCPHRVQ